MQHSQCVLIQRSLLEEYNVKIKYIPGKQNVATDALSRLPIIPTPIQSLPQEIDENIECPVDFEILQKEQHKANITGEDITIGHTRLQTIAKQGKKKIMVPN